MAGRRRGSRTARAVPAPNEPQIGRAVLKRQNTESDYKNLSPNGVKQLLEKTEGTKDKDDRVRRSKSYLEILKSEDPAARSCDGLSKPQIVDKLNDCVKAWWKTYDEAMDEFRTQNVEVPAPAPAPAAVAPEPEDYNALDKDALESLVLKRRSRAWDQNWRTTYGDTASAMRDLLRDQAADPSQWGLVAQHRAPAPKYADETVSTGLSRGLLDADTIAKYMGELTKRPPAVSFEEPVKQAATAVLRALPTVKDAKDATRCRCAIVERLARPATSEDVREVFLDATEALAVAWVERKMVPDGLVDVTVEDLQCRLEAIEAPEPTKAQLRAEPKPVPAVRLNELKCNSMYFACGLILENWSRDLALALDDDGIADYAKKAAQLKDDHNGNIGRIVDVRAAVAASIRQRRGSRLGREAVRSEIRNHTLPMRGARKRVHRAAVTSSHLMTWGY